MSPEERYLSVVGDWPCDCYGPCRCVGAPEPVIRRPVAEVLTTTTAAYAVSTTAWRPRTRYEHGHRLWCGVTPRFGEGGGRVVEV